MCPDIDITHRVSLACHNLYAILKDTDEAESNIRSDTVDNAKFDDSITPGEARLGPQTPKVV